MTISITLQINWEQLSPKAAAIDWVATFSVESMEVTESESLELFEELCFFFFPPLWFLVFCFDAPTDFLSFFLVVVFPIALPHATTGNNYQFSFFERQTPVETHGLLLTLSLEPLQVSHCSEFVNRFALSVPLPPLNFVPAVSNANCLLRIYGRWLQFCSIELMELSNKTCLGKIAPRLDVFWRLYSQTHETYHFEADNHCHRP